MGTATIAYNTLESAAHENLLAYIDNPAYVSDPRSPSGARGRVWIYDSDPFLKSINFGDFPYIVVNFPEITHTEPTADGKHKRVQWSSNLIVRSVRDGSSNSRKDQGRTDMLAISDDLFELFNSMTRKKEMALLNMQEITINKTSTATTSISQKEVYEWEYEIVAWSRISTST